MTIKKDLTVKTIIITAVLLLIFIQQDSMFFDSKVGQVWLILDSDIVIRNKPMIPYNLSQWKKKVGELKLGSRVEIIDSVGWIDKWKKISYKECQEPYKQKIGWIFASSVKKSLLVEERN